MSTKVKQFLAICLNPVLSVEKDGKVIYSNEAGKLLLHEWGTRVGRKLPSCVADIVQKVISQNNPEKIEVKAENRVYLVVFHPLPEKDCVNISGFDISDQKNHEDKLCENEEKYRRFFEHSIDGIILTDPRDGGKILSANPAICRMLGWKEEELVGKGRDVMLDIRDPAISNHLEECEHFGFAEAQLTYRRRNGVTFPGEVHTTLIVDNNGEPLIIAIIRDISERRKAEEAFKKANETLENTVKQSTAELENAYMSLKESKEGLAEAQELAHIGNWNWDIETDKKIWSDEVYRIFGFKPQEFGVTYEMFLSLVHPEDRYFVNSIFKKTFDKKFFDVEYRIVRNDGLERIIHEKVKVIFDKDNNPIQERGTIQDITERKKIEEKLLESEEKYRNIVETANEGIAIIDNMGLVTFANKKLLELLGYNAEEILNKSVYDLIEDAIVLKRKLDDKFKVVNDSYELKAVCKDGSKLWIHVNLKSIFNEKGEYAGLLGMVTDINQRKKAEESLAKTDVLRKQELHHRIKNNLQVISCLLDLQAEQFKGKRGVKIPEVLDAFRESQDRVISMALIHEELHNAGDTDILKFSRYIEDLADNLFLTYRLENTDTKFIKNIEDDIYFDIDTAIPLGIVINELISNSLKYAFKERDKGEIQIKLHKEETGECESNDCKSTSYVLSVSDNGVGIPENFDIENLDSLGLQLVTSLVDQLDGELELNRNNGTEFIIRFMVTEIKNV
jgi:PAS domain S-box-containing protein